MRLPKWVNRFWTPIEEQRGITLADFPSLAAILAPPVHGGMIVTEQTAMNFSAFFNAVDIISSQVAALPRIVYRRTDNDERERATTHPAYRVVHDEPNEYMTPFVFWQTLVAHALSWGNGYAEIEWDQAMRPRALWLITPDCIAAKMDAPGRLTYIYKGQFTIQPEDLIHVPGLGFDGIQGYSVVSQARRSLGLGLAAEQFGASFFGNGAWPGIVLEHPGRLTPEAKSRMVASIESHHGGPGKAFRAMVAEEGMKVQKVGIPPEDAQFLQTREFQVLEIARWFNLPPHKLKHKYAERPGGNLEAGQIEFLTDTLGPWLVRIEQECNRKLITRSQRATFYVEHLADAILRMDAKTRAETYKVYKDMGVLDAEAIAKKENLPQPKPPPQPMPAPPSPEPMEMERDMRMAAAQDALVIEAMRRFVRREGEHAKRAAKKGPESLGKWAEGWYAPAHVTLREYLMPRIELRAASLGFKPDCYALAEALAGEYIERSKRELLNLKKDGLEARVEALVKGWEIKRPAEMAAAIAALKEEDHAA